MAASGLYDGSTCDEQQEDGDWEVPLQFDDPFATQQQQQPVTAIGNFTLAVGADVSQSFQFAPLPSPPKIGSRRMTAKDYAENTQRAVFNLYKDYFDQHVYPAGHTGLRRVVFFHHAGFPLSLMFPVRFTYAGVTFVNLLQAYVYYKALMFGDEVTAHMVLLTDDPQNVLSLSKVVKNHARVHHTYFKTWFVMNFDKVMMERVFADGVCVDLLAATRGRELVYALSRDGFLGAGKSVKEAKESPGDWGMNVIGKLWMQIREKLQMSEQVHDKKYFTSK